MHELELNMVSYSDLSVKNNGLYKTILHESYELLAVCYSLDRGEVRVIDISQVPRLPQELTTAILDTNTIKYAYHAEWTWLQMSKAMNIPLVYKNWRSIEQMQQSVLIHSNVYQNKYICRNELEYMNDKYEKFFCHPQKSSGVWTRSTPEMFPEKWMEYKKKMRDDITMLRILRRTFEDNLQMDEWYKQQCVVEFHKKKINLQMTRLIEESRKESTEYLRRLKEVSHAIGLCNRKRYNELKMLTESRLNRDDENRVLERIGIALEENTALVRYYRKMINPSKKEFSILLRKCQSDGNMQGCTVSEDVIERVLKNIVLQDAGMVHYLVHIRNLDILVAAWLSNENWIVKVGNDENRLFSETAKRMWGDQAKAEKSKEVYQACLYGGGKNNLEYLRKKKNSFTEMELNRMVMDWRSANSNIVRYWGTLYRACCYSIKFQTLVEAGKVNVFYEKEKLVIILPSGRKIFFVDCHVIKNHRGENCISYMGTNEKNWFGKKALDGGKLFRLIVEALCQDIMSHYFIKLLENKKNLILANDHYFVIDADDVVEEREQLHRLFLNFPEWFENASICEEILCLRGEVCG